MIFNDIFKTPFFIIISYQMIIPFSNAIPLVEDNMLIAVMKGHPKIQISQYSMDNYEAYLGIVNYMKTNWHCDKTDANFDDYERTECQKYCKYLDILYEYLYREYAGIPTLKPKFVFKRRVEIEGPIIYAVNCLAKISQFYFDSGMRNNYKYELNKLFNSFFEPKLLNVEKLKQEPNFSINEMILQLAIDVANEWQTNESLDGIIRQNFEENLKEMFKKTEQKAKKDDDYWTHNLINDDKHWIISKFEGQWTWKSNALFCEFVRGNATTNFEKFLKMAKEYSNYLSQLKEKRNNYMHDDERMISFGLYKFEKMKKHLTQIYEANLGVMHLMRENWHCNKIGEEFEENKRRECEKNRKYLDILYEYLFRIYAEAKNPELSKQLPPLVKPIFFTSAVPDSLIKFIQKLNDISKYFWQKDKNTSRNVFGFLSDWTTELVNEEELNYEITEEKSVANSSKSKTETDIAEIRKEFDGLMGKICQNAKEDKAKSETEDDEEKERENEYDAKFGTFISSPFL